MKNLSPTEYSEVFARTGLKVKALRSFYGLYEALEDSPEGISNLRLSESLRMTAVRAGQITAVFSQAGLIEDQSSHPLRRRWVLSPLGEEVINMIKEQPC